MLHLDSRHQKSEDVVVRSTKGELVFNARWLIVSTILVCAACAPAEAQARALLLFGNVGRMFPMTNLGDSGDDMGPGATFGGGIGMQLGSTSAMRATFNFTNSRYRGQTVSLGDPGFRSIYYGLELMFGAPSDAGLAPYFFFGGGRISLDPAEPGVRTSNKAAGRLGTGINYVPDNSFFVLYAEAGGWLYKYELLGFNELQINVAIAGGIAFAVPY